MTKSKTLGEKVKMARQEMKLTQSEVSGTFITRTMLSKIENDAAQPSLETIKYIAKKLNKPIDYFINESLGSSDERQKNYNPFLRAFEHGSFLIKNNENEKALSYLLDIFKLESSDPNDIWAYKCKYLTAMIYQRENNYAAMKTLVDEVIDFFKEEKEYYYLSRSYYLLHRKYYVDGRFEDAEVTVKEAMKVFNKSYIRDVLYEIMLCYALGYVYYRQNNYFDAERYLLQSIELGSQNNCSYKLGECYMLLGIITKKMGKFKLAVEYSEKAVFFFNIFEEKELAVAATKNLGSYMLLNEDFDNAEKHLTSAMEYYKMTKDSYRTNDTLGILMKLYIVSEEFEKAKLILPQIDVKYLDDKDKITFFINVGKLKLHLKDYGNAEEYLSNAITLIGNQNEKEILLSNAYVELAKVYSEKGDFKKAYELSSLSQRFEK